MASGSANGRSLSDTGRAAAGAFMNMIMPQPMFTGMDELPKVDEKVLLRYER